MTNDKNQSIDPDDLPESDVFKRKEVYQYPQPQDTGTPLKKDKHDEKDGSPLKHDKPVDNTSNEQGLNETNSEGNAGAFEGFEDQQE